MHQIKFAGNDYLGLAADPEIAEAMCLAARKHGISAGAGRWSIGWTDIHQELEDRLSGFFGTEDTCIQGAAYLGGPAFFRAMADRYDTVFCDENSHPNLMLGIRGNDYMQLTYQHLDIADLKTKLKNYHGKAPIIATDALFGISGEKAPVDQLLSIARRYNALLFLDDAHGVFALGKNGRGTVELHSIEDFNEVVLLGSMSKALGVYGGFMTGRKQIIDKIRRAPNYVGSTPPPMPIVAACSRAVEKIGKCPQIREKMEKIRDRMREIVTGAGFNLVSHPDVPIVTLLLDNRQMAENAAKAFTEKGLILKYLNYPSEPRDNLLRTAARPVYEEAHLACFQQVLLNMKKAG